MKSSISHGCPRVPRFPDTAQSGSAASSSHSRLCRVRLTGPGFKGLYRNSSLDPYLHVHAPRYTVLLRKVEELAPRNPRILDVGAAYEAAMLQSLPAVVDRLGFRDERFPPAEGERHVEFDLTDAERPERWPELDEYDVVVCAEVIEHLPVSPVHVLRLLRTAIRDGGWLLVQTPNAARLSNRVRLLAGRNPFELLRESSVNPGHVREYTVRELLELGRNASLEAGGWLTADYFVTGTRANQALRRVSRAVPPSLRAGITAWFRKGP
jgi:SAM-dependent methyltransferase